MQMISPFWCVACTAVVVVHVTMIEVYICGLRAIMLMYTVVASFQD